MSIRATLIHDHVDGISMSSKVLRSGVVPASSEIHLDGFKDVIVPRPETPLRTVDDFVDSFSDLFWYPHRDPDTPSPPLWRRLKSPVSY